MGLVARGLIAVGGRLMLDVVEICAPLFGDRTWIIEVGFVELLDIRGIAAEQV